MTTYKHPEIILHVDDDDDDRLLVNYAIISLNQNVVLHQVQSGKDALAFLTQAKLSADLPDLIILDFNMPVMNGYDIYKMVKKDPAISKIPIVIFTTSIDSMVQNYWKNENIKMIEKPASYYEFKECIKIILTNSLALITPLPL